MLLSALFRLLVLLRNEEELSSRLCRKVASQKKLCCVWCRVLLKGTEAPAGDEASPTRCDGARVATDR